jgi:tRNA A-37 threonylcarbamoyl transferase component Bud32
MGALGAVIMDSVEGTNAYELYANMQLPDAVYYRVKEAIGILHAKSIVFGDLRLPNIIITDKQKPMLIDFDWRGMDATDRYPPSLNDLHSIEWHPEVARNGVMFMGYDIYMLNAMESGHPMDLSH